MKTLLLMRHAKSSWDNPGFADHARPLAERGRRDAPAIGRALADDDLVPEVILCSTATRTRQTAQGLFEAWGEHEDIRYSRELYHADSEDYLAALRELPAEIATVMIISHNPGCENFLAALTNEDERMSTANVAQIELDLESWAEISEESEGRLVKLWRPKDR